MGSWCFGRQTNSNYIYKSGTETLHVPEIDFSLNLLDGLAHQATFTLLHAHLAFSSHHRVTLS